MAGISATQVKQLRDQTGQAMMDCKRALTETDGDMEKAVDFLRKKGMAVLEKRGGRDTKDASSAKSAPMGKKPFWRCFAARRILPLKMKILKMPPKN